MTTELVIWSPASGRFLYCPPDDITWLDRRLLSEGRDRHLHRKTRSAGVRYVARRWELFSHDTSHEVYLTRRDPEMPPSAELARARQQYVLPAATPRLEPRAVPLDRGEWLVAIGDWCLVLYVDTPWRNHDAPRPEDGRHEGSTDEGETEHYHSPSDSDPGLREPPVADAVEKVRAYFEKRGLVHMAIAYYYQDFIRGKVGRAEVPMAKVAVALNLINSTAVADYKKELQRLIWNQPSGHQDELAGFLIDHGLIGHSDLRRAEQLAQANRKTGKSGDAKTRFNYRPQRPE